MRCSRAWRELAGTLVLDCGTGLEAPPARAALAGADQLVLVTDAEPDTASLVWEAARWLEHDAPPLVAGRQQAQRSLARWTSPRSSGLIPFARGLATVPHRPAAAEQLQAGRFSWSRPPADWSIAIRELAALLVADWPRASAT